MARDDMTIRLHLHRIRVVRVLVDTVSLNHPGFSGGSGDNPELHLE